MQSNRNEYIDIIKGVAIILVVVGHCVQFGSGTNYLTNETFYGNPVFKFIYSFHMPLFMLISGYLCRFSITRKSSMVFFLDKCKGILLPLISWHTCFQLVMILTGFHITMEIFFLSYFHTLWFLRALFVCYIIVLLIYKLGKDNIVLYIVTCLLMPLVPNRILPDVFAFTIPYFLVGYLYNKHQDKFSVLTRLSDSWAIYILVFIIFFFLLYHFKDNYYAYVTKTYLFNPGQSLQMMLFVNFYRNITAIFGCLFMLITIKLTVEYIPQGVISKILIPFGQTSLCIYIINHYLNELVLLRLPIHGINYLYLLGETILITSLGYICAYFLQKKKYLKEVFLGGR